MKIAIITTDNREPFRQYTNPQPWFGTAPEALLQGFASLPDVEVHVISCIKQPVKSPEKLAANIWFHSLHVPHLGWMRTFFQGCVRAVRKELKTIRPDIVHGQGTERECSLSAVFSGFPNVLTVHGNMRLIAKVNHAGFFSYQHLSAMLEAVALRRTNGVVCITRYTEDAVRDLAPKTWILPNAVDSSFFGSSPVETGSRTILFVGGICFRKNQNAFIQSLDPLAAKGNFKLVFLGQSDRSDPFVTKFLELISTRPWCEYVDFAPRDEVRRRLLGSAALVLPSLEDNCPMVVLEAMAAGIPVMASKVGGVPDLIDGQSTGIFCDPLDPVSMRDGVARLLDDRALAKRIATLANHQALERYHPQVIARRHLDIYREVLNKRSA